MKILVLSMHPRKHTSRLHLHFLDRLNEYAECYVYGYDELYPYIDDLKKQFMNLYDKHKPDVVIGYIYVQSPMEDKGDLFRDMKCAKIFIECDWWKLLVMKDPGWYKRQKFDLMMHRHAFNNNLLDVPYVWLPMAADPNEFYDEGRKRRNEISFAGSSKHPIYMIRQKAIQTLESNGLLKNHMKKLMQAEVGKDGIWRNQYNYHNLLKETAILLTSTEHNGPFAKTFEAMASKCVVLSSPIFKHQLLFEGDCVAIYKKDCSNIVNVARKLLNDKDYQNYLRENAYKEFIKKHTTQIRIKELYDNIVNLLEGKSIVRKWDL